MKMNWHQLKYPLRSFAIGFSFTLFILYTAINFYAADFNKREHHHNITHRIDQATIDWRLRFRGQRKASDQVVILAIDEKSLAQEGQWPWPRKTMARLIDEIMSRGAKVIGFDLVWAEKEKNEVISVLSQIKEKTKLSSQAHDLFNHHISTTNGDDHLGRIIKKYKDKLVLGGYFDNPPIGGFSFPKQGYKNLCFEQIYMSSKNFQAWDNLEASILISDQTAREHSTEMPEVWMDEVEAHFKVIEEKTKKKFVAERVKDGLPEKLNKSATIKLTAKVVNEKWEYCRRWLHPSTHKKPDENLENYKSTWEEVQEEDESFAGLSFEEGISNFKTRHFNSKVQMVGGWTLNVPSIQKNAQHMGYFNAKQDSDGTIRRAFLKVRSGHTHFPSMAYLTYLVANGYKSQATMDEHFHAHTEHSKFKGITRLEAIDEEGNVKAVIPVDKEAHLSINYAGSQKMFGHLSAGDVLNDEPFVNIDRKVYDAKLGGWVMTHKKYKKDEFFKDKIFVVGATAIGIYDLRVTPFEENFPGVETHANVIDNLVRGDFLRRHDKEETYMILFILVFGLTFSLIVSFLGALTAFLCNAVVIVVLAWVDWTFFFTQGWVVSVVFPFFLLFGIYAGVTVFKYFTEERNKKQLKTTFGKYVSPAIVEEILAHPDNIELGGRKQEVTVFFSDVRGFTTISETLTPTQLGDLLNDYLTPMTEIIFENKGTLDKYIGDAIMAFFGAPLNQGQHANDACRAALQNIERLFVLQKELEERNLPHIDVGIGLNTGEVSVGNMGSNIVRNYTIMGDAVNLGARLEGITKQYGVRIIISEYTLAQMDDTFITREVDCVRVKGKLEPVRIHELVGEHSAPHNMVEVVEIFKKGYQCYHDKEFTEAIELFKQADEAREDGEDPPSQLYIKRSQDYLESPPPEDWDGVFVMTTK